MRHCLAQGHHAGVPVHPNLGEAAPQPPPVPAATPARGDVGEAAPAPLPTRAPRVKVGRDYNSPYRTILNINDWRASWKGDVQSAELLVQYASHAAPVWRPAYKVAREGGFREMRRYLEEQNPTHPHLLRAGHREHGGYRVPVVVVDYEPSDKDGFVYRVIHPDGDAEDLTTDEMADAEQAARQPEAVSALVAHTRDRRRRVRILDLCCGTKSVGRVIRRILPHAVIITIDIDITYNPTIVADITHWDPLSKFKAGHFDIIWFSPPCTEYSRAKTTGIIDMESADRIVQAGLRIIEQLQPAAWFMENPVGRLRHRDFMDAFARYRHTCTYCMYGAPYRKETDIWTNVDVSLRHCGRTPCAYYAQHGHHAQTAQAGPTHAGAPGTPKDVAYIVPFALMAHVLRAALIQSTRRGRR